MILETKYEKRSFGITLVVFIFLFIGFYFYILKDDPKIPEIFEGGQIAINFGTSDVGMGDVQPLEQVQTAPEPAVKEIVETPAKNLVTQTNVKAAVIKTSEVKTTTTATTIPPKKPTNSALNSILKGPKNDGTTQSGHGDDTEGGDKGKENGSLYANGTYGNGEGDGIGNGKGSGYYLSGRKALEKPEPSNNCNDAGIIGVEVVVDKNGKVISAERKKGVKGASVSICLMAEAKKAALKTKFSPSTTGAEKQVGTIIYNFSF